MNNDQTAKKLHLAADIIETNHPWETKFPGAVEWDRLPNSNPAVQVLNDCEIRLVLAAPPDGRELFNPSRLTAEQVGRRFLPKKSIALTSRTQTARRVARHGKTHR